MTDVLIVLRKIIGLVQGNLLYVQIRVKMAIDLVQSNVMMEIMMILMDAVQLVYRKAFGPAQEILETFLFVQQFAEMETFWEMKNVTTV